MHTCPMDIPQYKQMRARTSDVHMYTEMSNRAHTRTHKKKGGEGERVRDRQAERERERETEKQTDRERETNRQSDREITESSD